MTSDTICLHNIIIGYDINGESSSKSGIISKIISKLKSLIKNGCIVDPRLIHVNNPEPESLREKVINAPCRAVYQLRLFLTEKDCPLSRLDDDPVSYWFSHPIIWLPRTGFIHLPDDISDSAARDLIRAHKPKTLSDLYRFAEKYAVKRDGIYVMNYGNTHVPRMMTPAETEEENERLIWNHLTAEAKRNEALDEQ